ncbi:hypothetical protein [Actinocorallia longicatena]|uniref:Uncharacterized protein n=1 Tax=Actinocorallia longicatena TaxID=111803 RepID=A0ABP6QBG4_9ACTN
MSEDGPHTAVQALMKLARAAGGASDVPEGWVVQQKPWGAWMAYRTPSNPLTLEQAAAGCTVSVLSHEGREDVLAQVREQVRLLEGLAE